MNANQKKFEDLANLKKLLKTTEAAVKILQKDLLSDPNNHGSVQTSEGVLVYQERVTHASIDSQEFIQRMGMDAFLKSATVTVGGVKKAYGEIGMNDLNAHGLLTIKSTSAYYSLRK